MPDQKFPDRNVPDRKYTDDELLDYAPLVAIDAIDARDPELAAIHEALAAATPEVRAAFNDEETRIREAMARVSETTAAAPPATLRDRILSALDDETGTSGEPAPLPGGVADPGDTVIDLDARRRNRILYAAAAAVMTVAIGAVGWAIGAQGGTEPTRQETVAEQVFGATDVQTRSGAVATGTASVTFSDSADAGVLVMNDVPPPAPGTVYQMWLVGPDDSMTSAGTMTEDDVAPSTTAVLTGISQAQALAFTVEPPGGSEQPTSEPVARLPLN